MISDRKLLQLFTVVPTILYGDIFNLCLFQSIKTNLKSTKDVQDSNVFDPLCLDLAGPAQYGSVPVADRQALFSGRNRGGLRTGP